MSSVIGITSTYVENTHNQYLLQALVKDHLHIRGEYNDAPGDNYREGGSPPHTWRIPQFLCGGQLVRQDHLHIRGEYNDRNLIEKSEMGSPPHTWRILSDASAKFLIRRITSTYVENTETIAMTCFNCRDHLHIRGEYQQSLGWFCSNMGSPPHTWRIPHRTGRVQLDQRITSTYVENTDFL